MILFRSVPDHPFFNISFWICKLSFQIWNTPFWIFYSVKCVHYGIWIWPKDSDPFSRYYYLIIIFWINRPNFYWALSHKLYVSYVTDTYTEGVSSWSGWIFISVIWNECGTGSCVVKYRKFLKCTFLCNKEKKLGADSQKNHCLFKKLWRVLFMNDCKFFSQTFIAWRLFSIVWCWSKWPSIVTQR